MDEADCSWMQYLREVVNCAPIGFVAKKKSWTSTIVCLLRKTHENRVIKQKMSDGRGGRQEETAFL